MIRVAPMSRRNANVFGVAAEQDVLAVVDQLAGLAVGNAGGAAAEPRPRFEHEHARARAAPAGPPALKPAKPAPMTMTSTVSAVHSHCLSAMSA